MHAAFALVGQQGDILLTSSKDFLMFVKLFDWGVKKWLFLLLKPIFQALHQLNLPENFFYQNIESWQLLVIDMYNFTDFLKLYSIHMCTIFHSSPSNSQIFFWGCSFRCKNLINLTCHTIKFHNCHYASTYTFIDQCGEYFVSNFGTKAYIKLYSFF